MYKHKERDRQTQKDIQIKTQKHKDQKVQTKRRQRVGDRQR